MSPDRTVLDPVAPPEPAARRPDRTTDGPGPVATVGERQPGASNSDFTTDIPSPESQVAAMIADPLGTVGGDYTPSVSDDPAAATGTFDPAAAPQSSGPKSLSKRPLPTVPGYVIHGILGRGGMGVVYRATQVGRGRQVALQRVLAAGHASAAQLERFAVEARAVAHVRHPNIIQIYEIGEHDGLPYFSLELCTGGSLDRLLNHEPQPPAKAAAILEKLARAMGAAHAANIIHRDLKPANILLDEHGQPKVTDFGLARELDAADGNTVTGSILGTPSYMAPEQARGETRRVGAAADQYSLGATLYDLLTGRPPFQGTSVMETLEQVRNRDPLSPRELQPGLPKDIETICLKALAKEPEKRYPTCDALADDLTAFLAGRPISARPVGAPEKAWRWAKRNPGVAISSAVAAVLLLATATLGTTFAVVFDKQKREAVALADNLKVSLDAEQAAKQVAEAKTREADASNTLTQSALQKVGFDAPAELRKSLYGGKGRLSMLELLGGVLAGQLDPANSRRLPERARLQYHAALGELLAEREGAKVAEAEFRTALALAEPIAAAADPADKGRANATVGQILFKLAQVVSAQGRLGDGDALLAQAEAVIRAVVADPASADVPLADRRLNLAAVLGVAADRKRAAGYFPPALAVRDEQVAVLTAVTDDATAPADSRKRAAPRLADARRERGRTQAKLGNDPAAEADFTAAVKLYEGLDAQTRTDRRPDDALRKEYARAARDLGDFLLMRDRLADAAPAHLLDLKLNKELAYDTEVMAQRQQLAQAYYRAGVLGEKKNGAGKGLGFFRSGLEVVREVADAAPANTVGRARALVQVGLFAARCGDHAAAVKDMPALLAGIKNVNAQANLRLDVASVYAVASGATDGETAKTYRAEAFAHLDWMLAPPVELADPVRLRTDPDFDAIKADPRFAAAVAKAAANGKSRAAEPAAK